MANERGYVQPLARLSTTAAPPALAPTERLKAGQRRWLHDGEDLAQLVARLPHTGGAHAVAQ